MQGAFVKEFREKGFPPADTKINREITDNGLPINQYVILDDYMFDIADNLIRHLVLTDESYGLTQM